MNLRDMAAQYRENARIYEERLEEIRARLKHGRHTPQKRKELQRKAIMYEIVIGEAKATAAHLDRINADGGDYGHF